MAIRGIGLSVSYQNVDLMAFIFSLGWVADTEWTRSEVLDFRKREDLK